MRRIQLVSFGGVCVVVLTLYLLLGGMESRGQIAPAMDGSSLLSSKLNSAVWTERETAVGQIVASQNGLKDPVVVKNVTDLLDRETQLVYDLLRQGTSSSEKYGEGFSEYYSFLLGTVFEHADLRDPHVLTILAKSSYNDDSSYAMQLADAGGVQMVPIARELLKSDLSPTRWNGVELLSRLYEKKETIGMTAQLAQSVKQAIVQGTEDSDDVTRIKAVKALGRIGTRDDISLIQKIATTDPQVKVGSNGVKKYYVREEAVKAISQIQARLPK